MNSEVGLMTDRQIAAKVQEHCRGKETLMDLPKAIASSPVQSQASRLRPWSGWRDNWRASGLCRYHPLRCLEVIRFGLASVQRV
jgi:hypothetical protein